ncbi:PQQ-binding-like beta-propeller repeat protein [bacterium]|nr:PQQ-binding-like beta-propeller repeat protein [bacterium]
MKTTKFISAISLAAIFAWQNLPAQAPARNHTSHDWPQWRGPQRDGKSLETGLLKTWPQEGPKVVWRSPLGEGYSGIAIANGLAYTMYDEGNDEYLACFDAKTGKRQWRVRTDRKFRNSWGNGPRVTPLVEGEMVYTLSAHAKLYARNAKSGAPVWQHDLVTKLNDEPPDLGYSNSPIIEGDLLLVTGLGSANRSLVAFNKNTGELVWSSHHDHPGYSSPIVVTALGLRQAVFFTGTEIASVSPDDGKIFWRHSWRTDSYENVATPVFIFPDKLFFSSAHPKDAGAAVLQMKIDNGAAGVTPVWKSNVMQHHFASSVLHDNYLYGTDRYILKCVDSRTGEQKWQQRGFGEGSVIFADGHLIVLGTSGNLALVEATPAAYRERARAQVLNGKCYTAPALAYGRLYLRNESEILCLALNGSN